MYQYKILQCFSGDEFIYTLFSPQNVVRPPNLFLYALCTKTARILFSPFIFISMIWARKRRQSRAKAEKEQHIGEAVISLSRSCYQFYGRRIRSRRLDVSCSTKYRVPSSMSTVLFYIFAYLSKMCLSQSSHVCLLQIVLLYTHVCLFVSMYISLKHFELI